VFLAVSDGIWEVLFSFSQVFHGKALCAGDALGRFAFSRNSCKEKSVPTGSVSWSGYLTDLTLSALGRLIVGGY
jgi:hypothetical protein